jgi:putative FmdB family regulatory protein
MPTYDYACKACDHAFELFQQMSADLETVCPECGEESLKRLIGTGSAVIFRGSGFYETDYRTKSYKSGAEAEKKANESTSTKKTPSTGDGATKSNGETSSSPPKKPQAGPSTQSD